MVAFHSFQFFLNPANTSSTIASAPTYWPPPGKPFIWFQTIFSAKMLRIASWSLVAKSAYILFTVLIFSVGWSDAFIAGRYKCYVTFVKLNGISSWLILGLLIYSGILQQSSREFQSF